MDAVGVWLYVEVCRWGLRVRAWVENPEMRIVASFCLGFKV